MVTSVPNFDKVAQRLEALLIRSYLKTLPQKVDWVTSKEMIVKLCGDGEVLLYVELQSSFLFTQIENFYALVLYLGSYPAEVPVCERIKMNFARNVRSLVYANSCNFLVCFCNEFDFFVFVFIFHELNRLLFVLH